jgi:DNA-directed RNA polymerase subunit alpha
LLIVTRPQIQENTVSETRSKFSIEPLEPGFGYTLGNALRRTLLSSIPGAAISSVRIEGVLHEFATIPKVTEDVTDVILNLKGLVLRSELDEPTTIYVKAKGPGEVTAGDVSPPAGVDILNSDLHIATLGKGASLEMEMVVERGVGYRPAERNKKPRDPIGVIPVDSIFSPVRRVAFNVEPTRVEQATNYDRLVLEIETDGSITPADALSSAGKTLRSLIDLVAEMSADARGLELGDTAVSSSAPPELDLPIEELDLSERPRNCLKRAQVDTIGQLIEKSEEDLLAITNFGQKSLEEVIQKLDERGLSLRVKD